MTPKITLALAIAAFALSAQAAFAQIQGVEKLYIMNCGEGVAGDIGRWSPGVNEGKSMDFVDTCYLIKHAKGWFLWDTGIPDAVAAMPNGLVPVDPKAVFGRRQVTAEDARFPARADRGQARRHQGDGHLAHPSRSHRQCRDVPAGDALRAESRI